MKYKPFGNRVVAKITKDTSEKKTAGGLLYLAPNADPHNYDEMEIVAVGRGYPTQTGTIVPMESQVGDIVYVSKNAWLPLPASESPELAENEEYGVFQESEIIVKVGSVNDVISNMAFDDNSLPF